MRKNWAWTTLLTIKIYWNMLKVQKQGIQSFCCTIILQIEVHRKINFLWKVLTFHKSIILFFSFSRYCMQTCIESQNTTSQKLFDSCSCQQHRNSTYVCQPDWVVSQLIQSQSFVLTSCQNFEKWELYSVKCPIIRR